MEFPKIAMSRRGFAAMAATAVFSLCPCLPLSADENHPGVESKPAPAGGATSVQAQPTGGFCRQETTLQAQSVPVRDPAQRFRYVCDQGGNREVPCLRGDQCAELMRRYEEKKRRQALDATRRTITPPEPGKKLVPPTPPPTREGPDGDALLRPPSPLPPFKVKIPAPEPPKPPPPSADDLLRRPTPLAPSPPKDDDSPPKAGVEIPF